MKNRTDGDRSRPFRLGIDCRLVLDKPTGIGSYILGTIRGLSAVAGGLRLQLVTGESVPATLTAAAGQFPDVGFWECPLPPFGLRQKLQAHRYLNRLDLDVLLYPHHDVPFSLKMPVVTVVHHVPSLFVGTGPNLAKRMLLLSSLAWSIRRSQRVVAVSGYTAQLLRRFFGVPGRKIAVIYPPPSPVMTAEKGVPLPGGLRPGRYFLSVAEWRPHKNLARLVRAFARARSGLGGDWKLAIAGAPYGDGRWLPEEVERAGVSEDVLLLGKVGPEGLRTLYENAAALVFVSLLENFGYPVVEAFHFGTPVICSNAGSLPEVAGNAAVLVNPRDEIQIADAMLKLAADPGLRQELVQAGKQQLPRFSPAVSAEQTLKVCKEAARNL
ncbi:MAG TPA: glycosyltransferase family 1 protein [Bacteroidetes bacterium]|nr:glycosyltransferase family 1 protein [Bacteroidota bacterium]